jgi:hypothetical protein
LIDDEHRNFTRNRSALAAEARRRGISVEALVEDFISDRAALTYPAQPELPVWRLGGAGALHRRDLYSDVG